MSPEDEREFREFVTARSAALLRVAYLLTGDVHHAQDLLQTALLGTVHRWAAIRRRERPRHTCAPRCTATWHVSLRR